MGMLNMETTINLRPSHSHLLGFSVDWIARTLGDIDLPEDMIEGAGYHVFFSVCQAMQTVLTA